ncbi:MAG: PorV/PorQ family protein [Bacteroidota bacterium]|nr:PorV/PorQ family protein [Bacteroidota bacterium]
MKKTLLLVSFLFISTFAQNSGSTGLSFLKFGFGARNIAMGDAGNSVSNDISALNYNPARLAVYNNSEITFMHNQWIQDTRSEALGVSTKIFGLPFALGLNVTSVNDIEVRTIASADPLSSFNAHYFSGSLSTGFNVYQNISFGATVKYLYEGMLSDEATGWAGDFGLNYITPLEGLNLSCVVRNIGGMNVLRTEKTKLPGEFRIGGEYEFGLTSTKLNFTTAVEFLKYFETDNSHINLGIEVLYDNLVAIRSGYQTGFEGKNFSAGFGLHWGIIKLDYAFVPFTDNLGSVNIISINFSI